jgi:rubrerythrin
MLATDNVDTFLAYAIRLEQDAAHRFADLKEAMKSYGDMEVAEFFARMEQYSRLHLAEAKKRAQFHDLPAMKPEDFVWPEGESPEACSMEGSHYLNSVTYALELALESERAGHAFYARVLKESADPEVQAMAREFVAEEAEHVAELEAWLGRYKAA